MRKRPGGRKRVFFFVCSFSQSFPLSLLPFDFLFLPRRSCDYESCKRDIIDCLGETRSQVVFSQVIFFANALFFIFRYLFREASWLLQKTETTHSKRETRKTRAKHVESRFEITETENKQSIDCSRKKWQRDV